jgi:hypothetical protein
MSKTATDIVTKALTLLDEQLTEFATAATTEMSLKDIALDILPEVCRNLMKSLPYELKRYLAKSDESLAQEALIGGEDQTGLVKRKVAFTAPTDFWELVAIRLSVWSNPQTRYILIDDPIYTVQNNPFTRSGKQNPTVAISNTTKLEQGHSLTTSHTRIECFSVHNEDEVVVSLFQYISFDNVPDDTNSVWPDELFEVTSKALASELMLIKNRLQQSSLIGNEGAKIIEQHK